LLLARSPAAPELPGILELGGVSLEAGELAARWGSEIARRLDWSLVPGELSAAEMASARRLTGEKYAQAPWNRRR
jgi:hypothetical protein